jgi:hypothetical protein
MAEASYQRTNLDWQLQQFGRRVNEWVELQFTSARPIQGPELSLPPWLLKTLFWVLLVSFVAWLIWQLVQVFKPYISQLWQPAHRLDQTPRSQPQKSVTVSEWLRRAQNLQRQGNYTQACRVLYMAMLQRLNDTKRLSHQASLTDGEFLQVVQTFPKPQPYRVLIHTHEQLCFSDAQISAEVFNRCQQAYQEIEAE